MTKLEDEMARTATKTDQKKSREYKLLVLFQIKLISIRKCNDMI